MHNKVRYVTVAHSHLPNVVVPIGVMVAEIPQEGAQQHRGTGQQTPIYPYLDEDIFATPGSLALKLKPLDSCVSQLPSAPCFMSIGHLWAEIWPVS